MLYDNIWHPFAFDRKRADFGHLRPARVDYARYWSDTTGIKATNSRWGGSLTANILFYDLQRQSRAEYLNENWFLSLADARGNIEQWLDDYNCSRPHSFLGELTQVEFVWRLDQELGACHNQISC